MDSSKINYVKADYTDANDIPGWFQLRNNELTVDSDIEVEKKPSLRVQDSNLQIPGIIRFNKGISQFQGYTGGLGEGTDGWTNFLATSGTDGKDGNNSIVDVKGTNLQDSSGTEGVEIFESVNKTTQVTTSEDITTDQINNLVDNIFSAPSYQYSNYSYGSTSDTFLLQEKNITFVPNTGYTAYSVYVRDNDMYPKVPYYSHDTVRTISDAKEKIGLDNHFAFDIPEKFTYFGSKFASIYIHENGYINFNSGDITYFNNIYTNHFSQKRISALMGNLVNNSSDTDNHTNQGDVYIGKGKYGELVITYNNYSAFVIDPNDNTQLISSNYNNFQIRIWLDDTSFGTSTTFSDDHYPVGTIQIVYGKCEYQSPLIGLSNKVAYNELTYAPIEYNTLNDFSWDLTKGLGVPELKLSLLLVLSESDTSGDTVINGSYYSDSDRNMRTKNVTYNGIEYKVYKTTLVDSDASTSYSEKQNGIIYYTKVFDLKDIKPEFLLLAIKSLFDYEQDDDVNQESENSVSNPRKFSSSTKNLFDTTTDTKYTNFDSYNNGTEENTNFWENLTLNQYVDVPDLVNTTYTKDYLDIFTNTTTSQPIYNSKIHKVQLKYTDVNSTGTGTGTTKLYSGSTNKKLFLKVIYTLKSDIDIPTTHSFDTATDLTSLTITTSGVKTGEAKQYIPNYGDEEEIEDFYTFKVNNKKKVQISLLDYFTQNVRKNYSLKMTIYDSNKLTFLDTTTIGTSYEYPTLTINNLISGGDLTGTDLTYYLSVKGTLKSYFYEIKFRELDADDLTGIVYNILNFTLSPEGLIYSNITDTEKLALYNKIKAALIALEGITLTDSDIYAILFSSGSLVCQVYFSNTVDLSTSNAVKDKLNEGNTNLTDVTLASTTYSPLNINSVTSTRTTSLPSIPSYITSTGGGGTDDGGGSSGGDGETGSGDSGGDSGGGGSGGGGTTFLEISKTKQDFHNGNIHDKSLFTSSHSSVNVFESAKISKLIGSSVDFIFSYINVDYNSNPSKLKLFLLMPSRNDNGTVTGTTEIETITFYGSSKTEINTFPYKIYNQGNDLTVIYGLGDSSDQNTKTFKIKKYEVTVVSSSSATVIEKSGFTTISTTTNCFASNTGCIDEDESLYYLDVISSNMAIKKLDVSGNNTTYRTTTITYAPSKIYQLQYSNGNLCLSIIDDSGVTIDQLVISTTIANTYPEIIFNNSSMSSAGAILYPNKTVSTFGSRDTGAMVAYYYNGSTTEYGSGYYYPLFLTEDDAKIAGQYYYNLGSGATAHTHVFNGGTTTLYMPNGLDSYSFGHGVNESTFNINNYYYTKFDDNNNGLENIKSVVSTKSAFLALRYNGKVFGWGYNGYDGGNSGGYNDLNITTATNIYSLTDNATFGVLDSSNNFYIFGYDNSSGSEIIPITKTNISQVFSNKKAFALINSNSNQVEVYGDNSYGGSLSFTINSPTNIFPFKNGFVAETASNIYIWGASLTDNNITKSISNGSFNGSYSIHSVASTGINYGSSGSTDTCIITVRSVSDNNNIIFFEDIKGTGGSTATHTQGLVGITPLENVSKIVGNQGAFAILLTNGSVVTIGQNYYGGNSGQYFEAQDTYSAPTAVYVDSLLTSGVTDILATNQGFIAVKSDGLVVWGNESTGRPQYQNSGGNYINLYSSSPIISGSFSSSDISISEYTVIARKSDGSCIGWGSSSSINLTTLNSTTGIYKLYLNYFAYGLDSSGDINRIGEVSSYDSYFRDVGDSSYDTSGKLSFTNQNIPKLSFIDSYTNRFRFATETINGYNYFFTHDESKYQIYSDRLNTSFLDIENTILPYNSDNHFYKFKHYTGGSNNYILIDVKKNGGTRTLFIYKVSEVVNTNTNTLEIIDFETDPTDYQASIIINDDLYVMKYSSNNIEVKRYVLSDSTPITLEAENTFSTSGLNLGEAISYGGIIDKLTHLDDNSFYMLLTPTSVTDDDPDFYKYTMWLFDKTYSTRDSSILSRSLNIPKLTEKEEITNRVYDKLEYVTVNNSNETLFNTYINNNDELFLLTLIREDEVLEMNIYNNNDFNTIIIKENIDEEDLINIVYFKYFETENKIFLIMKINSSYIIKLYEFELDIEEIQIEFNSTLNVLANGEISNIVNDNDKLYFIIKQDNEINYILYYEQDLEIFINIELDDIEGNSLYLEKDNDLLNLYFESNEYIEINLEDSNIEIKYLVNKLLIQDNTNIVNYNSNKYFLSKFSIDDKIRISINNFNEMLYIIGDFDTFNLLGFEKKNDNIFITYTVDNIINTILRYNILNGEVILKEYKFQFFEIKDNNVLLFDTRERGKIITIRYLYIDTLDKKVLNIFRSDKYQYNELKFFNNEDKNFRFMAVNDEEISLLNYIDNSSGEYKTFKSDVIYDNVENDKIDTQEEIAFLDRSTTFSFENLSAESVAKVVQDSSSNYVYIFNFSGSTVYDSNKKYKLNDGKYLIKDVPMEYPLAILNKNSSNITFKGLNFNNKSSTDSSVNMVKKLEDSQGTEYLYNFYYGDIEVDVKGDFGNINWYVYDGNNNSVNISSGSSVYYFGSVASDGNGKFVYDSTIPKITSTDDKLYLNEYINKEGNIISFSLDPNYSPYLIGREKEITYADDDTGTLYYTYNYSYYNSSDIYNMYLRANSVPNYVPTYGTTEIKGLWKTETTNTDIDNHYAVRRNPRGWIDINNIVQGTTIKIPLEPAVADKKNYTIGTTTIRENFWYIGDLNWKTIMTDTNYDNYLLTPMGAIGIGINGVPFYNFAVMSNAITNTFSSTSYTSTYNTTSTLTTSTSYSIQNAYNTVTEIMDSQGGFSDINFDYHHHTYPFVIEGMNSLATWSNRDPDNNIISDNLITKSSFKLFIGHKMVFNQSKSFNNGNPLRFTTDLTSTNLSDISAYTFDDTIQYSGYPGIGLGSNINFTVPRNLTENTELRIYCKTHGLGMGSLYNNITVGFREVNLKLKVNSSNQFEIYDSSGTIIYNDVRYNSGTSEYNELYFERDVKYILTGDASYDTENYNFGLKKSNGDIITLSEVDKVITFKFDETMTNLYVFNQNSNDSSGTNYLNINVYVPQSIHYYVNVLSIDSENKFRIYNTPNYGNLKFTGLLEYEDAFEYLKFRKTQLGTKGHSPLLGFAFDGFPIYGCLGYDKSNDATNYNDNTKESSRIVKFLTSSYTGSNDSNGNPTYISGSGDLDICNGIFSKTPEYPNGIYHYVCTLNIDSSTSLPTLVSNNNYGYRNITKQMISPSYPYIIGAYRGIPEIQNFPWATTSSGSSSSTTTSSDIYNMNFRSFKSDSYSLNGSSISSINLRSDTNHIYLRSNPFPYVWNFTNSSEIDGYFGIDNKYYGNTISNLKSINTSDDTEVIKAYGQVMKFVSSGSISRGTAVRFVDVSDKLCVETYSTTGLKAEEEKAAFLGIALNNSSSDGNVYVCTKGITTVELENSGSGTINCGSYGIVVSSTEGKITALSAENSIDSNSRGVLTAVNTVAGYFVETLVLSTSDTRALFYVKGNFEFD